ncbi:hypothetical protein HRR83_007487 [Exophiala dermatitidis]|uniref:Uncharacterized protein n=2 Tax=Exophiala dermatitidis TaxID=5970 RepID=H6C2I3_EXODN|nr:uncharacterized protein HMPREF1120_06764 [Exophiala dermatitidis NIH/UT8656]KAJ4508543.1 hypothetical protein HRR75_006364 [Exophiala dermatitidis]EHY58761.1 hypothetical protein HMPREF1120_06764 [Exophiala dermatitidis NIH/UT8656]KAJ4510461.1 hypothetical protein HRR74_006933 [Exophiala dermatitidis]KAJ4510605.1 hypothetical protein HRR73_006677 [Exophiala dermatitidis]KAJ4535071.1 hypothetical protein HRR76_006971 [Exophiala dermatitidis]
MAHPNPKPAKRPATSSPSGPSARARPNPAYILADWPQDIAKSIEDNEVAVESASEDALEEASSPEKSEPEIEPFRFMDLFPELRFHIYDFFTVIPPETESSIEERREIQRTRRSLLGVSKDVYKEWAPIFYWNATVRITGPEWFPPEGYPIDNQWLAAEEEFEEEYMAKIPDYKLKLVRNLTFDHVTDYHENREQWINAFGIRDWGGSEMILAWEGYLTLGDILRKHMKKLPSVQRVVFSIRINPLCNDYRWYIPIVERPDPNEIVLPHQDEILWGLDYTGQFEILEDRLMGNQGSGVLRGWKVEREFEIRPDERAEHTQNRVACTSVTITYTRDDAVMPRTIEEWIRYGKDLGLE